MQTIHSCQVRFVYEDGTEFRGDAVGAPAALEAAAYDNGAIGVTVVVVA